jgi:thiamine-phosphate pyrophosphorylase
MCVKMPEKFGFYAILTNPLCDYEYITSILVDYKVAFVQLRMKDRELAVIEKTAEKLQKITAGSETRLIIDDFPCIAHKVNADGVHIGQTDMEYAEARSIVGKESIIGISTHSPLQTRNACMLKPDYIGVGPVYETPTKKIPDPVLGLKVMKNMISISTVPAVAIGGITLERLPCVLETGAKNFAMVRPVNAAENPEMIIKKILRIYANFVD